ncbi:hypothetical protein DPSP01_004771 [Paraphaeosphaeria sporulosa]|uniref:Uncharacterized protein n=1 Tax=Paraphaeosphaeria sporulosa TaxID=1460663 RepID=A0A177CQE7_9PLEO|nr:uncharacterized protein CC84DRAFT_1174363 [Paraphaeosphaeria sporulosa]OAG08977.1 hypothetical protein CC84DRAFT_1174363 [Paraphaeosphaeria sporulosa]
MTIISGLTVITAPGPTISRPQPCWWMSTPSVEKNCLLTGHTTVTPTPVVFPTPSIIPSSTTLSISTYGPASPTGSIDVVWPSSGCDGFIVNETCVPWQYWLDMYNEAFPPTGWPKPQASVVFQTPDLDIRGPNAWCNGFVINNFCLRVADVLAMLGDRFTRTSSALTTATASDPALAPAPHNSNPKLGFIAIPIIVILVTVIGGTFFWRRRAPKKASPPAGPPPPIDSNPIANIAQLYGPPYPDVEQDPRPSMYERRSQGGRYLRNGVKIFDVRHANRERQKEMTRRGQEIEQGPSSLVRKEWWDKDLLF